MGAARVGGGSPRIGFRRATSPGPSPGSRAGLDGPAVRNARVAVGAMVELSPAGGAVRCGPPGLPVGGPLDPEPAAAAGPRLDPGPAAGPLGPLADDGQPD